MATYSIAFIIGTFDFVEKKCEDNVLVRVYTPVERSEEGTYALEIACAALPFVSSYLETPFPLQKLDHVALAEYPQSNLDILNSLFKDN
jgi:puromycin-sensitive aminopeptidase